MAVDMSMRVLIADDDETMLRIISKQAGVNDDIVKPCNAETLRQKIVSVIGQS
ncbi:MAG: hypothetical protein JWM77_3169 [Rhodospirillales bacterium]|nr:hypothetical protein [Rhodospirillales bacterium]